jgi:ParB-like chromosome segregation protein Spo0J
MADGRIERLTVAGIDLRYESLRLGHPSRQARVRLHVERGVYLPVVASDGVEPGLMVLIDGFKRVRAAKALDQRDVLVQVVGLEAVAAVAAILASNSGPGGLTAIEEALIVAELLRNGLNQTDIGTRLDRHKSWVCRRVRLLEGLHAEVLKDVRVGLVTPAVAREVARLPRGNQPPTAHAIHEHRLTSREAGRLVDVLKASPGETAAVLADPRAHIASTKGEKELRRDDARLGKAGNRLRFQLLRLESAATEAGIVLRECPVGLLPLKEGAIVGKAAATAFRAVQRARKLMAAVLPATKTGANDATP